MNNNTLPGSPALWAGSSTRGEVSSRTTRNIFALKCGLMFAGDRAIREAAIDFRYLLNRGYPRIAVLELAGNRYQLTYDQRHLLYRGVFSDEDSMSRRKKHVSIKALCNRDLAIDGYNVLITIETALSARPLVVGNDGFIRDISGLSGRFRKTAETEKALELVVYILKKQKPFRTLFLFYAPVSKSGRLAQEVRQQLKGAGLPGEAMAVRVPEEILIGYPGIVATSDTSIIDQSPQVFDLAGHIIKTRIKPASLLRLSQP